MKRISGITRFIIILLIIGITSFNTAVAQSRKKPNETSKEAVIKSLVDSQNFVFVPQLVSPMRGSSRQLTSYYDLRMSQDTLISYLPYFGRAQVAPADPTKNSLDFTSTDFEYTKTVNKKGGWDILIKPKDQRDVQQLSFRIFDNGSASLGVASANRDPITFQGYITEKKRRR